LNSSKFPKAAYSLNISFDRKIDAKKSVLIISLSFKHGNKHGSDSKGNRKNICNSVVCNKFNGGAEEPDINQKYLLAFIKKNGKVSNRFFEGLNLGLS
jgi:hypothetical protein